MYLLPPELLFSPDRGQDEYIVHQRVHLAPGLIDQLSSLKTLSLSHTSLDEVRIDSILSCCPNLENMALAACILPPLKLCISGSLKRLKLLAVLDCHELNEIELFDTNLTTFEYAGGMIKFSFSRVPNLEKVFFRARDGEGMKYAFCQLAKDLHLIKNLSVYWELDLLKHLPEHMTAFNNVKLLELFCGQPVALEILELIIILRACPDLEKFYLMMDSPVFTEIGMDLQPK